MHFNHPEVLHAFFLLIIPIIVHLFQLRKFQKEHFTNVKFLKRLTRQTRKSSKLKKWLVLCTRLLLLSCIIIAFAQPYIPGNHIPAGDVQTLIYLDNSYSMQAYGKRGRLLDRSVQEILENIPQDSSFTLFTNNEVYRGVSRRDLQEIEHSPTKLDFQTVFLRAQNLFTSNENTQKNLLIISDFQQSKALSENYIPQNLNVQAFQIKPETLDNISIDTVFQTSVGVELNKLMVQLSYTGTPPGNVPVSFFNGSQLLGKTGLEFADGNVQQLEFPLESTYIPRGRIEIEDRGLSFDNQLFFSLNEISPIKVVSIEGAVDTGNNYLNRIFSQPEFVYFSMPENRIDYNTLAGSKVIILNEIADLPVALENTLLNLAGENAVFVFIPSQEGVGDRLSSLLGQLGGPGFVAAREREKLVTGVAFQHPLYYGVFEEEIRNFEYPRVQASFEISGNLNDVLKFEDNSPFLVEGNGNFFFTAPLNRDNSNFVQSPLIVPTFYNMGISALRPVQLYYLLGETNQIDVPVDVQGDRVVQIGTTESSFIPRQQKFTGRVEIITNDLPQQPGNFDVEIAGETVYNVSFNVNRVENLPEYHDLSNLNNIQMLQELPAFFTAAEVGKELSTLWKWFVIFALIFLIAETLLLKYIK